jgi:hypothetical protein
LAPLSALDAIRETAERATAPLLRCAMSRTMTRSG